jgi:cell division protein FtsB
LRFKKTSFLTKLLLLIVAVYAVYMLVRLQDRIQVARQTVSDLEAQVVYAEQDNAQLKQDLDDIDSDRSVKSIARNRLGMVEAGEIVFRDADMHD